MMSRTWFMVNNPADDCMLPVIIGSNQSSCAVVQLQGRIKQYIGNTILSQFRANGTNNYPLWFGALNNEAADHHVVARLHKAACANVAQRCRYPAILKCANVRNARAAISTLVLRWRSGITTVDSGAA